MQVVVGFVEQDAMRKSGSAPEGVQRGQGRPDVLQLFIVREAGQIDDHAAVRVAERPQQLPRRRRSVFATQHGDAGQPFERAVVAFWIDGTDAVAVENELFAQETRDPGLSGLGIAGDQDVASANRQ